MAPTSTRIPSPARVSRAADDALVASECAVADRFWPRLRGLLGRGSLSQGEGLLITPAGSVHMIGMRFAIDVVFVDWDFRVVGVAEGLKPWRMAGCRGARQALELPAGTIASVGLTVGDVLSFEAA